MIDSTILHDINQLGDEKPGSPLAPAARLGLPVQGGPWWAGLSQPRWLLRWKEPLRVAPQAETPVRRGAPPECWEGAEGFYRAVLLEVPLKKNEGSR